MISQGKLIYDQGHCVRIRDSKFEEDELKVIRITKDLIDPKAKNCSR